MPKIVEFKSILQAAMCKKDDTMYTFGIQVFIAMETSANIANMSHRSGELIFNRLYDEKA